MFERSYKNLNTYKTHCSVFHVFQAKLHLAKLKARQALLPLSPLSPMGEGWGQAVASSDLCPSEYLIHLHYLLVWFNMACIMKRSTATSNMPPDSSPKEAVRTCRRIVGSYTKTERTLSLPISFYRSCSFGSTSRL